MSDLSKYCVSLKCSIREAFKQMDVGDKKFILVVDDNDKVIGIVTDGDFRRAIWASVSFQDNIITIMNEDFVHASEDYEIEHLKKEFRKSKTLQQIPILKLGYLQNVIFREDLTKHKRSLKKVDLPVVIMAGGTGTRLDPFTRILPKPLIPIGNKPMIEVIMDEYAKYGIKLFYVSVNHKAKIIKAFFEDFDKDYSISYLTEEEPYGTAGALKFLDSKIKSPFFVSNCDIIVFDDYAKIYEFHTKGRYDFTLIASVQHHTHPYGVCEIDNGGELKEIREKPEYDLLVNTGMYLVEPSILDLIPDDKFFDMTDLIKKIREKELKIGVYPVSEKSWVDVGRWEEYEKALNSFKL